MIECKPLHPVSTAPPFAECRDATYDRLSTQESARVKISPTNIPVLTLRIVHMTLRPGGPDCGRGQRLGVKSPRNNEQSL